jgi:TIR domain
MGTSVKMPKVFISYSWTSNEHQQWVLDLATALRDNGVDAILDKWDLKEGHDAITFMERMVNDESVEKVIIILDRRYAETANDRKGGVGTETQIITPQIYASADQNKFVGVASEVGADGKPFKPAYYAARIHIDLSNEDTYAENFDQLLRWIFNKPAYPKPSLGKPPEFLKEESVLLPTRSHAQRVVNLLRSASPAALGALVEYFDNLSENFGMLRIKDPTGPEFDEEVLKSISAFLPYRDEFVGVVTAVAKSALPSEEFVTALKRFFE